MSKNERSFKLGSMCGIVLALAIPLCACAQEEETRPKPKPDGRYLPFAIKFDPDGAPVIVDAKGEVIQPEELKYPIKATSIERVDSVVMVRATGSHFMVIKMNNKQYNIPLPH